jgi:hypothetical protein
MGPDFGYNYESQPPREHMDMATAISEAKRARQEFDQAVEHYEVVRKSASDAGARFALLGVLTKARVLGWAVEQLEIVSERVSK